jgi:hypothetical protein
MSVDGNRTLIVLLAVGALGVSAAVGAVSLTAHSGPATDRAKATTLTGDFTPWSATARADPCRPRSEAPDIRAGAPVDIRGRDGATVAVTTLSLGRPDATR